MTVQVNNEDGFFRVEVTYREPFEHFFEIAVHNAKFVNVIDANRLAERVRAALKENGLSRSHSFVIGRDHWNYRSSAYTDKLGSEGIEYVVEPTEFAKRQLDRCDL